MNKWTWIGSSLLVALFVYMTRGILLPFIAGLAVAYFLDPMADILEKRKVPRGIAAALVLVTFFLLIIGVVLAFWPIVKAQISAISETLPQTLANLRPWLDQILADLSKTFGLEGSSDVDGVVANFSEEIFAKVKQAAAGLLKGGLAIFNIMTLLLITPVVAFYLLRDWDLLVAKVDGWLPPDNAALLREQFKKINEVLAGFVRGQMLVSGTMGIMYAVGWQLVGLQFGIILGVLAGIMSFVPFVGALFAALIAIAVGIGQWGFDLTQLGFVALVFLVVQIVEGSFLTPRFVGERVGLHAVWVLFAVFAGGEVMGFLGVLIAVPAAATIAVLVRLWIKLYVEHYEIGQKTALVSETTTSDIENDEQDLTDPA